MNALNARPSTKQNAASAMRRWSSFGASAPATPHAPQPSICHGVHVPCPRKKFETNAASAPPAKPLRAPRAAPAATVMTVTGCTPGIAAKRTRPAAAAAPSVAIRASSFAEPGLRSSQATPAARSAKATSKTGKPAWERSSAVHTAAANAVSAAVTSAVLDKDELPPKDDRAISDRTREVHVV